MLAGKSRFSPVGFSADKNGKHARRDSENENGGALTSRTVVAVVIGPRSSQPPVARGSRRRLVINVVVALSYGTHTHTHKSRSFGQSFGWPNDVVCAFGRRLYNRIRIRSAWKGDGVRGILSFFSFFQNGRVTGRALGTWSHAGGADTRGPFSMRGSACESKSFTRTQKITQKFLVFLSINKVVMTIGETRTKKNGRLGNVICYMLALSSALHLFMRCTHVWHTRVSSLSPGRRRRRHNGSTSDVKKQKKNRYYYDFEVYVNTKKKTSFKLLFPGETYDTWRNHWNAPCPGILDTFRIGFFGVEL